MLGGTVALTKVDDSDLSPEEAALLGEAGEGEPDKQRTHKPWLRLTWITAGLILLLGTAWSVGNYFGIISYDQQLVDRALVKV